MSAKRTVLLVAIVVGTCLVAAACGSEERVGNLDLFGLRTACMARTNNNALVVSPGEIDLADGQVVDDLSFDVDADGDMDYRLGVATAGLIAGDLIRVDDSMTFMLDDEVELEGPGNWPLALLFTPDGDTESLSISKVRYTLDGETYAEDVLFDLAIEDSC